MFPYINDVDSEKSEIMVLRPKKKLYIVNTVKIKF